VYVVTTEPIGGFDVEESASHDVWF
jgi:hypothetical protein